MNSWLRYAVLILSGIILSGCWEFPSDCGCYRDFTQKIVMSDEGIACGEFNYALADTSGYYVLHFNYQGEIYQDSTFELDLSDPLFSTTLSQYSSPIAPSRYICNDVMLTEDQLVQEIPFQEGTLQIEVSDFSSDTFFDSFQLRIESKRELRSHSVEIEPFEGPSQSAGWLPG